jgi:hypothetical protein
LRRRSRFKTSKNTLFPNSLYIGIIVAGFGGKVNLFLLKAL